MHRLLLCFVCNTPTRGSGIQRAGYEEVLIAGCMFCFDLSGGTYLTFLMGIHVREGSLISSLSLVFDATCTRTRPKRAVSCYKNCRFGLNLMPITARRSMLALTLRSSTIHAAFLFLLWSKKTLCRPFSPPSSINGAPWQQSTASRSLVEEIAYADLPSTVFSPTGRLHSIDGVIKGAKANNPRANLVMAMNCRDGIVMVSTVILSPYLNTTNNSLLDNNSLFTFLSPNLVAATAGNAVDGQALRCKLHQSCQSLIQQCGDDQMVTSRKLARHVADQLQVPTQTIGKSKLLAVGTLCCESEAGKRASEAI